MSRYKKPDAPKFEPVFISGYRQAVHSLATPEDERKKMIDEDLSRIVFERAAATLDRLGMLHGYLGLSGKAGENLLPLLIAVANKYVPDFEVQVGVAKKRGAKKVGDRFKTVTEVESVKILQNLPTIAAAIDAVAAARRPRMQTTELTTKYYACLKEIRANAQAAALLKLWQDMCSKRPDLAQDTFFDSMFWDCERDHMGATMPHNVTNLRLQK